MADDKDVDRSAKTGRYVSDEFADEHPNTTVSEQPWTKERPGVGRVVHYVSYGTPGGEFTSQCRAATITEVYRGSKDFDEETIGLSVQNPTGLFFHPLAAGGCEHSEDDHRGGTWHWPERV